jgi:hypothetical protein
MPQQEPYGNEPERYEETMATKNPPNSVLRPIVRRTAVWTYLGAIVAVVLLFGALMAYFAGTDTSLRDDDGRDPAAIGTSGERMPREGTPGGFDPSPSHDSTASELEHRGGGEPPQGPMPGLSNPLTRLGQIGNESPQSLTGRRIEMQGLEVERAEGATFQVRDGGARATVIAPGSTPTVQAGQRVDVVGTIETAGDEVRIRASRIDVREP